MGIQDTKRRQEEQLAAKAEGQQKQPSTQSHPIAQSVIDMQTLRQMIENVVRAELQGIRMEQPQPLDMQVFQHAVRSVMHAELQTIRDEQPRSSMVDVQALQHAVQSIVRAELQTVQTTLTLLVKAIQAQTDTLMIDDQQDEEQEQDEPLPTALPRRTDDDIEDEQVYPPDEEETEDDEGEEGGEEDDDLMESLPRPPEPPTHKLRRTGPESILLGGIHPSAGIRRWEQQHEV